ncbi:ECF-type sigma factor [Aquisalinus flavus]|uniref:DNA-directed RNA polymerase sigma-70 factor n=1 Tax=Aquisalinus flavus TaxID=1526572 RepID=A0A8J2V665_9PROT|nr:ECF-type sigma factor [Aquisalinus flavus]GGD14370.1 DNA-directed RNA polymerase sigma-70 factor [Aquisalinus flavus]
MRIETDFETRDLFDSWRAGSDTARDALFARFYNDLRRVSAALLRREGRVSLSTGDLVNEVVMRLIQLNQIDMRDKAHFMALSAKMMRRVLIDHVRKKQAGKRHHHQVTLITNHGAHGDAVDLLRLEEALRRLQAIDPKRAEIVELRYFGGLSVEEVAEVTGLSASSVKRSWQASRVWLMQAIGDGMAS